jgi:DNA topoisomerase III
MKKQIVIAEKPSVARDIARVMGVNQKSKGYFENQKMIVTWALGHLVQLAGPERYEARYTQWRLEDLPIMPNQMKLEVIPKTRFQYEIVKKLLLRGDVDSIIIATDAGREGELVARWIIEMAKCNKPISRLWISSVTDKAIKQGFTLLKDGKQYIPLFHAAIARAEADWIVGINATRALTSKYNAQLSTGRVQTPTIALVHEREEMIRQFKSKTFANVYCFANQVRFMYVDQTKQSRIFDLSDVDAIKSKLQNKTLVIKKVNKTLKRTPPPTLYDLTSLQQEANQRYGFSPKNTLSIVQSLYENHKVLTYPRTDSKYISSDIVSTLKERLIAIRNQQNKTIILKCIQNVEKKKLSCVNDQKVSDHHAIIPTEEAASLYDLSDAEAKIYEMVVKRFIAALMESHVYEQTAIEAKVDDLSFHAKGNVIVTNGWKDIYEQIENEDDEEEEDKIQILPTVQEGQRYKIDKIEHILGETKPPKHFTEGTLVAAMENPTKYTKIENKDLKHTLEETGGLGTVATRAEIIEKLFQMNYIELRGKDIVTTSKGRQVLMLAPKDLRSPHLTAKLEQQLAMIAKGKMNKQVFMTDIRTYTERVINEIKHSKQEFKHDNVSHKPCPTCGKPLLEVNQKDVKMLKCQDRACNYKQILSRMTNARCPVCHKRLECFGDGDQAIFVCVCGHRERKSVFEQRIKEKKKEMSSKDAKLEISKLNKESEKAKNNQMAEALKNLLK